jgi:hypothetical protein
MNERTFANSAGVKATMAFSTGISASAAIV